MRCNPLLMHWHFVIRMFAHKNVSRLKYEMSFFFLLIEMKERNEKEEEKKPRNIVREGVRSTRSFFGITHKITSKFSIPPTTNRIIIIEMENDFPSGGFLIFFSLFRPISRNSVWLSSRFMLVLFLTALSASIFRYQFGV